MKCCTLSVWLTSQTFPWSFVVPPNADYDDTLSHGRNAEGSESQVAPGLLASEERLVPSASPTADSGRVIAALKASYEAKVDDLRLETLRTSAALRACRQRGFHAPQHVVGEALAGWDAAMEYVEAAIQRVSPNGSSEAER